MDVVLGLEEDHQPSWSDVDYIYNPINYHQYWMMVIDINQCQILVYDSYLSYILCNLSKFLTPTCHTILPLVEICSIGIRSLSSLLDHG